MLRMRLAIVLVSVLLASACGGGATGVAPPPPASCPSGSACVSGTAQVARVSSVNAGTREVGRSMVQLGPPYVPDQLVVRFKSESAVLGIQSLHAEVGGVLKATIPRLNVHVVKLTPGSDIGAAIARYRQSPLVLYVEQDRFAYKTAAPNDRLYPRQWHYSRINLPGAWDVTTGGPVIVAVIDDGIVAHPDLLAATVQGRDFYASPPDDDPTWPGCSTDPSAFSHGAHVAGTIAAVTNNSTGVAGVNWGGATGTKIMPVRTFGPCPADGATQSANATAIVFAADQGAKIINMSWGGSGFTQSLKDAVDYAYAKGVTLVAAAGNSYPNPVLYPAAFPNVIAVAATNCADNVTYYSQAGPEVDVAAPGGSNATDCGLDGETGGDLVWSTSANSGGNGYFRDMGTSMAAPHVSGVAALLIARGITGPASIQSRLQSTATPRGTPVPNPDYGYGVINAAAAVGVSQATTSLRAFSGEITGSTISRQSDLVLVSSTGAFFITSAQTGAKSIFVWQDFNDNGIVDAGDNYGQTDGITITLGTTSGVVVVVRLYTGVPLSPVPP